MRPDIGSASEEVVTSMAKVELLRPWSMLRAPKRRKERILMGSGRPVDLETWPIIMNIFS